MILLKKIKVLLFYIFLHMKNVTAFYSSKSGAKSFKVIGYMRLYSRMIFVHTSTLGLVMQ